MGNLDAKRDWGHARDYVDGMWRILQHPEPDNFVLATGLTTSVRDFTQKAFEVAGIFLKWEGSGASEIGRDTESGSVRVRIAPASYRPTEVDFLLGDARKAREKLDWVPKYTLDKLIEEMVLSDLGRPVSA